MSQDPRVDQDSERQQGFGYERDEDTAPDGGVGIRHLIMRLGSSGRHTQEGSAGGGEGQVKFSGNFLRGVRGQRAWGRSGPPPWTIQRVLLRRIGGPGRQGSV